MPPATSVMAMSESLTPILRASAVALSRNTAAEDQPGQSADDHQGHQPPGHRPAGGVRSGLDAAPAAAAGSGIAVRPVARMV